MIGGDKSEDSIARMVIGRKMDNMVEIVKNTDSTNCEKYPTYVEYVPIKKSLSMKNLLERKGYSNPDSTYSIQALQRAMRKQQAGASVEKRKYSSNPKIGVKHLSEKKTKRGRHYLKGGEAKSESKRGKKKKGVGKMAKTGEKFRGKTEGRKKKSKGRRRTKNLGEKLKEKKNIERRSMEKKAEKKGRKHSGSVKNIRESLLGSRKRRKKIIKQSLNSPANIIIKRTLKILYKERNEKRKSVEKEKKKKKDRLIMLKNYSKKIRDLNNNPGALVPNKPQTHYPWGVDQRKFLTKTQSEKLLHGVHHKHRAARDSEQRRRDLGLTGFDIERAKQLAQTKNQKMINQLKLIESVMLRSQSKKALTERQRSEINEFRRKKKKQVATQKQRTNKEKEKKTIKIKKNLEALQLKAKHLARSKSKKRLKSSTKCKSAADLSTSNMSKKLIAYLRDNHELMNQEEIHQEFERIYKTYKNMINGVSPNKKGSSSSGKKMGRSSSKAGLNQNLKYWTTNQLEVGANGSVMHKTHDRFDVKGGLNNKSKKSGKGKKNKANGASEAKSVGAANPFKKKKQHSEIRGSGVPKKAKEKSREDPEEIRDYRLRYEDSSDEYGEVRQFGVKDVDISESSVDIEDHQNALYEDDDANGHNHEYDGADSDSISNASEKHDQLNEAATCIQKVFKGFITRKKIRKIYEYYEALVEEQGDDGMEEEDLKEYVREVEDPRTSGATVEEEVIDLEQARRDMLNKRAKEQAQRGGNDERGYGEEREEDDGYDDGRPKTLKRYQSENNLLSLNNRLGLFPHKKETPDPHPLQIDSSRGKKRQVTPVMSEHQDEEDDGSNLRSTNHIRNLAQMLADTSDIYVVEDNHHSPSKAITDKLKVSPSKKDEEEQAHLGVSSERGGGLNFGVEDINLPSATKDRDHQNENGNPKTLSKNKGQYMSKAALPTYISPELANPRIQNSIEDTEKKINKKLRQQAEYSQNMKQSVSKSGDNVLQSSATNPLGDAGIVRIHTASAGAGESTVKNPQIDQLVSERSHKEESNEPLQQENDVNNKQEQQRVINSLIDKLAENALKGKSQSVLEAQRKMESSGHDQAKNNNVKPPSESARTLGKNSLGQNSKGGVIFSRNKNSLILNRSLTSKERSRRNQISRHSTPSTSKIRDVDLNDSKHDLVSVSSKGVSITAINEIIGFYQKFAMEQLNRWNEVNEMVESLKKGQKQPLINKEIKETIDKLRTTSELNIRSVKTNIKKMEGISRDPSRKNLKKKQPIKPALTLDIKQINKKFTKGSEELKKLHSFSNKSQSQNNDMILLGSGVAGTVTPSQSHSHRKSIEKWIYPDAEKVGRSNIDLARAILIDPEALNSNKSSQKFSNINELRSLKSDQSVDEDTLLQSHGTKMTRSNISGRIKILDNMEVKKEPEMVKSTRFEARESALKKSNPKISKKNEVGEYEMKEEDALATEDITDSLPQKNIIEALGNEEESQEPDTSEMAVAELGGPQNNAEGMVDTMAVFLDREDLKAVPIKNKKVVSKNRVTLQEDTQFDKGTIDEEKNESESQEDDAVELLAHHVKTVNKDGLLPSPKKAHKGAFLTNPPETDPYEEEDQSESESHERSNIKINDLDFSDDNEDVELEDEFEAIDGHSEEPAAELPSKKEEDIEKEEPRKEDSTEKDEIVKKEDEPTEANKKLKQLLEKDDHIIEHIDKTTPEQKEKKEDPVDEEGEEETDKSKDLESLRQRNNNQANNKKGFINVFDAANGSSGNIYDSKNSSMVSSGNKTTSDVAFDQLEPKIQFDEEDEEFFNFDSQRIETDLGNLQGLASPPGDPKNNVKQSLSQIIGIENENGEDTQKLISNLDEDFVVESRLVGLLEKDGLEEEEDEVEDPSPHEDLIKNKKVDILTVEVFNHVIEELMMDGFVLRELLKLQGDNVKGIKTNINAVKGYLGDLSKFIQENYMDSVLFQLNNPLGPTPEERLRLFHAVGDDDNLDSSYAKINYEQVLDIDIYFELEDKLLNEGERANYDSFQVEIEHIHNKLLFDCLNESLDSFRVFGLKGMPLPLKNGGRIERNIKTRHLNQIMGGSSQKVMEWSTFMCGFIPFKDDSFIEVPRFLDEETLTQIKEDRLVRLLTDEALENDDKWLNYEDEEIEVEIELADVIFDHLICDTLECLLKIKQGHQGITRHTRPGTLKPPRQTPIMMAITNSEESDD